MISHFMDEHRESYEQGKSAYRLRRYACDTRERLYSGLVGANPEDTAFRRGFEDERKRHLADLDAVEWDA